MESLGTKCLPMPTLEFLQADRRAVISDGNPSKPPLDSSSDSSAFKRLFFADDVHGSGDLCLTTDQEGEMLGSKAAISSLRSRALAQVLAKSDTASPGDVRYNDPPESSSDEEATQTKTHGYVLLQD